MKKNQKHLRRFLRSLAAAAVIAAPAASFSATTIDIPEGTSTTYTLTSSTDLSDYVFTGAGTLILNIQDGNRYLKSNLDNFTGTIQVQNSNSAVGGTKLVSKGSTYTSKENITLDIMDGAQVYSEGDTLNCDIYAIGTGHGNGENRGAVRCNNITVNGDLYLKGDLTVFMKSTTYAGKISGTAAADQVHTLTFGTNAETGLTTTVNGVVSDGANGGKLAVNIAYGQVTFNAANTYTGGLTVNGDAVAVLGNSARVAGNYQVNSNGRLDMNIDGSGRFANMVFAGDGIIRLKPTNANALVTNGDFSNFTGTIQFASGGGSNKFNTSNTILFSHPDITLEVLSGGQIFTSGTAQTIANPIKIAGTGNSENRGAIRHTSGTISGPITLTANATIGLGGGNVSGTISGSAAGNAAHTLTLGTSNEKSSGTFSGVISDGTAGGKLNLTIAYGSPNLTASNTATGALLVTGGTPTLSNTNQFSSVTVTGGTLTMAKNNTTIAKSTPIVVGTANGAAAVLKLNVTKAVGDHAAAVTIYDGARLEIHGGDTSIANGHGITFVGGGEITGGGTFWLRGANAKHTLTGENAEATIAAGQMNIFAETVGIDVQEASSKMTISSKLHSWDYNGQFGSLNKLGAGELVLSNSDNNFLSAFGVQAGKLTLTSGASFPGANVTVSDGAIIRAENDVTMKNFTLNGTQELAIELLDDGTFDISQIDVTGTATFADGALFSLTTDDTFALEDLGVVNLLTAGTITGPDQIQVLLPEAMLPTEDFELFANLVTLDAGGFAYQLNLGGSGVPEPSTWALLILGSLGLLAVRRKKN